MAMPPRAVTAETASVGLPQAHRLVGVAREFGDGAEGAEAPLRIGIGDCPLQQIDGRSGHRLGMEAVQA